ncbi:putative nitroreductase [Natranaerovirga pectinivora]|uniref:Putative nitroreductase n=1 Tax=Natranaerovirga pectinivora TaxID=682400 RepID=A0A4R3MM02_9FIRM|nr:nitroreductase family protein [Natranaerovirga pectinivora]TCT15313.1 putative nitroreductase [Natranaerovirga pectinivora]
MQVKSIIETIKRRKSIRTYENKLLNTKDLDLINSYIKEEANLISPLGKKIRFQLVPVSKNQTEKGKKIGTYGFIKNPQAYIVGSINKNEGSIVDFGYVFEKFILYLTEMNIGTCWLGGTFNRNNFEEEINIEYNEIIPCITPIGYESENQRFLDKTIRHMAKSDKRKPWSELFFYNTFNNELKEEEANIYKMPLEMVRLSPSASNKQPYRIIVSKDYEEVHFFLERTPKYPGNNLGFEMQKIDIGIAMCHFELSCNELGLRGEWEKKEINIDMPNKYYEYIMSWKKTIN